MVLFARTLPLVTSFVLHALLTALMCFFAVCLTMKKLLSYQFALAAAAADVVNLCSFAWIMIWALGRPEQSRRKLLERSKGFFTVIVVPAVACTVTVLFLIMIQFEVHSPTANKLLSQLFIGKAIYYLLNATWGVYAASVLVNICLVINFRMDSPPARFHPQRQSLPRYTIARISPTWTPPSPLSLHGMGIANAPTSPYMDNRADSTCFTDTYESFHSSHPYVVRSVTSRTRLAPSPLPLNSESCSSPEQSSNNFSSPLSSPISPFGFVEHGSHYASRHMPVRRLESIPGSRCNSPENPGSDPSEPSPELVSEEPVVPQATTSTSTTQNDDERRAARISHPPFPESSESLPIDLVAEPHIHPLFRSDSPQPPPTPTPSSSLTASAFGGRFITSTGLARVRARSVSSARRGIALQPLPINVHSQSQFSESSESPNTEHKLIRVKSLETARTGLGIIDEAENIPPVPALPPRPSSDGSNYSM